VISSTRRSGSWSARPMTRAAEAIIWRSPEARPEPNASQRPTPTAISDKVLGSGMAGAGATVVCPEKFATVVVPSRFTSIVKAKPSIVLVVRTGIVPAASAPARSTLLGSAALALGYQGSRRDAARRTATDRRLWRDTVPVFQHAQNGSGSSPIGGGVSPRFWAIRPRPAAVKSGRGLQRTRRSGTPALSS
jgi:hypothetical protein